VTAHDGLLCRSLTVSPGGVGVLRELSLEVAPGTRTVLVGPSGAGKTTLLRAIAGLEPLDGGEMHLVGRRIDDLAAHRRRIAVVFQEPRLLPHLRVEDNVALTLRAAGVGRGERRARARAGLEEVGLGGFAGRRTQGLSGGEQQRVALARALCAEPDLLMLDEPLAALDPNRREELRRLIARVQAQRGLTTLVITHDRAEAAELGERVALMLDGRIVQHDEPRALFERPVSAAVARFFGVANLLDGTVCDGHLSWGGVALSAPGPDGPATLAIRPDHIELAQDGPLRATVTEAVYTGAHVRLVLLRGDHRLEAHVAPALAPPAGTEVTLDLPAQALWRLPGGSDNDIDSDKLTEASGAPSSPADPR